MTGSAGGERESEHPPRRQHQCRYRDRRDGRFRLCQRRQYFHRRQCRHQCKRHLHLGHFLGTTSTPGNTSNAGNVTVAATGSISLANGGVISADTYSAGNHAGAVMVSAASITIDGSLQAATALVYYSSRISSQTNADSTGYFGNPGKRRYRQRQRHRRHFDHKQRGNRRRQQYLGQCRSCHGQCGKHRHRTYREPSVSKEF